MAGKKDQFSEIQKKNLDAARRLAELSLENSRRVVEIQVETAKSLFEDGVTNVKALTSAQDPQEMLKLRTQQAQLATEKMLDCARRIAEISSETQNAVGKMVVEQLAGGGQEAIESMQKMFSGMPIADQNMGQAFQAAIESTRAAFEQMTRSSTEAFQAFTQPQKKK